MTEASDSSTYEIVDEVMKRWRQGDVAAVQIFSHIADLRRPVTSASEELSRSQASSSITTMRISTQVESVVVLTQTCDIRRSSADRPYIEVCPLIRVAPATAASAAAGERPSYAALPTLGDNAVADLDRVMTVEKGWLSLARHIQGWTTDSEIRKFQAAVARRYERFAFPDDFTKTAGKLREKILSKHGKLTSPEGQLFSTVSQVRVNADPHWSSPDIEVTLSFILPAGTLSEVPEETDGSQSINETLRWLSVKQRSSTEIAERILSEADPGTRDVLWTRMAEAWARLCNPYGCIRSVFGEVRDASEYPISEYWESSPLDLDYLSDDGSTRSGDTQGHNFTTGERADEAPETRTHDPHSARGLLSRFFHFFRFISSAGTS
jgi:hypothetical protein